MVLVVGAGLMLDAERGVVGATEVRGDLDVIVALYAELPAHLPLVPGGALTGSRGGADSPMPGGTVLALLGPGSDGNEGRRLTTSEQAHGVAGREHGVDNKPEDPPSVEWALGTWEQDWRETRGEAG